MADIGSGGIFSACNYRVDAVTKKRTVNQWLDQLDRSEKSGAATEWRTRCKNIKKKYLYEASTASRQRKYQMLWSNTEQMKSAIYSKPPHGVVNRRYSDQDPVARIASQILERAINFTFDTGDYDTTFARVRDDFILYGRGIARVYYEPTFSTTDSEQEDIEDAADIKGGAYRSTSSDNVGYESDSSDKTTVTSPDQPVESRQELDFENVRIRFIHRQDFRHDPARIWEEVNWVAFRAFMSKDELAERFGDEIAEKLEPGNETDDASSDDYSSSQQQDSEQSADSRKIAVWEVWDKPNDSVCWLARGHEEFLEEGPPYLEVNGFFPCPCPVYGTLTNDSLVPVPDYHFYRDQAAEVDQLTARIGSLADSLKLVGFYPAGPQGEGAPEIERAFLPGFENKMIAVQSWAAFKEGGSGQAPVLFLPIDQVIKILEGCVKLRQQVIEDIYQIIGISDIMRGATDPNETAQAQQMKAQFGGVRIRDRQRKIALFCAGIAKLVGQIIAGHCQPSTIEKMTNIKLPTNQDLMAAQFQYKQQIGQMVAQYQSTVGPSGTHTPQGPPVPAPGSQSLPSGQLPAPQQSPGMVAPAGAQGPGQAVSGSAVPAPPQIPPPPQLGPTQEQVFGLLKDDIQRLFRIDIEAESTVTGDESQERQDRVQLIESTTKFLEAWGPMVQARPDLAPLAGALLMFGVRAFRVGRELEQIIEETVDKFEQEAKTNPQGGKVDPKAQTEQIKLQSAQLKGQAELQKAQIDAQIRIQEAQAKLQEAMIKAQSDREKVVLESGRHLAEHSRNVVEIGAQALADHHGRQHQAQLDHHARQHQQGIQEAQGAQQAAFASGQSAQDHQQAQEQQQAAQQTKPQK